MIICPNAKFLPLFIGQLGSIDINILFVRRVCIACLEKIRSCLISYFQVLSESDYILRVIGFICERIDKY